MAKAEAAFAIVRCEDVKQFDGDYHAERVILDFYDAMQQSIRTGALHQTCLDPPIADPCCRHSPRNML